MQQGVALPVVGTAIHDDALHRRGGVVASQARSIAAVILGNNNAAPIGVEENLGGIKPHSARGIERPLHPIPVKLSRLHARYEDVPVVVRTVCRGVDRDHAGGAGVILPVKEQQLHS